MVLLTGLEKRITTFFLNNIIDSSKPKIIIPGKNKFFESYFSPYRELIQRADSVIREASAFFIVGFGFNDQHLTPKVISKIRSGTPIVIITKIITDSCKKTLSEAKRYLCIEENQEKTKITYKEKGQEVTCDIEGSYWKLDEFLRVLDE